MVLGEALLGDPLGEACLGLGLGLGFGLELGVGVKVTVRGKVGLRGRAGVVVGVRPHRS